MEPLVIASCCCLVVSIGVLVYVLNAVKQVKPTKKETARRLKDYPSTYPYGWYKVADSYNLKPGDLKHVETCGKQFVVFRGLENKKVGVLDALCIHLGANIAVGGKVVKDCVQCPFHQWEFDTEGKCQKIPYQSQIPERAQTKSYPCIEYYGLVLVWYDPQMRPPKYFPPTVPEMDENKMVYCNRRTRDIGMHLLEIAENTADFRHFEAIHNSMKIPHTNISLPFGIIHKVQFKLGTEETNDPGRDIPGTTAVAEIDYIGVSSLIIVRFNTPAGLIILFQTHLPIDQLNSHVELVWYREKRVPRFVAWYVLGNWVSQWQKDIDIWEHKTFIKPFLVKGDGPIMKFRRWLYQFYDDPQMQIEYETEDKNNEDMNSKLIRNMASILYNN